MKIKKIISKGKEKIRNFNERVFGTDLEHMTHDDRKRYEFVSEIEPHLGITGCKLTVKGKWLIADREIAKRIKEADISISDTQTNKEIHERAENYIFLLLKYLGFWKSLEALMEIREQYPLIWYENDEVGD